MCIIKSLCKFQTLWILSLTGCFCFSAMLHDFSNVAFILIRSFKVSLGHFKKKAVFKNDTILGYFHYRTPQHCKGTDNHTEI